MFRVCYLDALSFLGKWSSLAFYPTNMQDAFVLGKAKASSHSSPSNAQDKIRVEFYFQPYICLYFMA